KNTSQDKSAKIFKHTAADVSKGASQSILVINREPHRPRVLTLKDLGEMPPLRNQDISLERRVRVLVSIHWDVTSSVMDVLQAREPPFWERPLRG
ncbi:hypothetical protein DXG03_005388, partial [Asterophora parasitica]